MEEPFFERGYQLFQIRKYKEALQILQKGLQREPENYIAKSLIVKCHLELEQYEEAGQLNDFLITQFPNEDELFYHRAILMWKDENKVEALNAISEAIRLDPYCADYFGYKGFMLLGEKEYEKGLLCANEGLELAPNNVLCLNVRAKCLTKLDRKEEARETIGNTLNQDPEGSFSHANVGWVELEQGNHEKAMEHFRQSLKQDPNSRYAKDGMLEAIKAKNFVYRAYLRYAFWISNMKTKNQWFFIIGIYLVYRFLVKAVELTNYPSATFLIIVPYLLFALGGWIIGPLSNMILLFHSHGKYLLTQNDRLSGILFFSCFVISLVSLLAYFGLSNNVFLLMSIASLCAVIPLSKGALIEDTISKWVSFGFGSVILGAGFIGSLLTSDLMLLGGISFVGLILYTWIGNVLKP